MRNFNRFARRVAIVGVVALATMPSTAFAGEKERAVAAIAEANGKISAGNMVGASAEAMGLQSRAKADLARAQDLLSHGKKAEAIEAAQAAGQMADQAIALTDMRKTNAMAADRADARASAASAQQSAAMSAERANAAQQEAAAANARADDATLRAQTPPPAPPSTTTTIATERQVVPATTTVHKKTVVHHTTAHKPVIVEKTTVVQTSNP